MIYTAITIAVFSLLSIIAYVMHEKRMKRLMERELERRWKLIEKQANELYYLLHYTIKDLNSNIYVQESPAMLDLSIDIEKLGKPMDEKRMYAVAIEIRDDLLRLSSFLAEYRLQLRDDVLSAVSLLIAELESFMELERRLLKK